MVNVREPRGMSTLELLIAFAILTLTLTAVVSVVFGNQSVTVDTETDATAIGKATKALEAERALAKSDYQSATTQTTSETDSGVTYTEKLEVSDLSPCLKRATSTVSWSTDPLRTQKVELTTLLTDVAGALLMGGDCGYSIDEGWTKPRLFASFKFNPGQPVALDVLQRIAYVTTDNGKLEIADTSGAYLGLTHGSFYSPEYSDPANLIFPDIDVIRVTDALGNEKRYALVTHSHQNCNSADISDQFEILNVTTPGSPSLMKSVTLGGSNPPSGSCPGGWRVYYFDGKAYVTTRYTSGYELHVIDVSTPSSASETGSGFDVGGTANELTVAAPTVNGSSKRVVFLATDRSTKEVMAVDMTDPANPKLAGSYDLPDCGATAPNALSIYGIGNHLYVGRQSTSCGPELYVLTPNYSVVSGNLAVSFSTAGTAEIGSDINAIRVTGDLVFLATSKANDEFQVWGVSDFSHITRVDTDPIQLPNKIIGGMDFESPYVYVGSQATDPLQILYSAP